MSWIDRIRDCDRAVKARDITEYERTIAIFDRVSPSVVRSPARPISDSDNENSVKTGTGFVWDPAGMSLPTISRTGPKVWRLNSRQATLGRRLSSVLPAYDLAVIVSRIRVIAAIIR
jgi:hypothetical protein